MLMLSKAEGRALDAALRTTRDRRHWVRLRGVRLAADGETVAEIGRELGAGVSTVFDWLAHWRRVRDPAALADAPRSGQPRRLTDAHRARLEALLAEAPAAHGYHAEGWTVPLLVAHFARVEERAVSETTLRRALHALGYRWKRPRFVLARRDPEREGKKTSPRGRGAARPPRRAEHGGAG